MRKSIGLTAIATFVLAGAAARADDAPPPPPVNDDFDQATVVTSLPFTDVEDTRGATGAADDPWFGPPYASVWYRFTPDRDLSLGASTFQSDYVATVYVYTGSRGALQFLGPLWGSLRIPLTAGTTYSIMVWWLTDSPGGHLVFGLTDRDPPSIDLLILPFPTIDHLSRMMTVRVAMTCSRPLRTDVSVQVQRCVSHQCHEAGGELLLECSGAMSIDVPIQTYDISVVSGHFTPGPVTLSGSVFGWDVTNLETAQTWFPAMSTVLLGSPDAPSAGQGEPHPPGLP